MLTAFRRYLETWPVRLFFGIMVIAFVIWGVGDVVRQIGTSTWLAKVGGETVEPQRFQEQFQRDMSQAQRQLPRGQDVTPELRRQVADQALQQIIGQVASADELARLRVVVPDTALRQAVFSLPQLRGPSGQFDRATLDALLRNNGLSEQQFLALVRSQLAAQQLMGAVSAGASAPELLRRKVFDFAQEKRSALMVELPFAAAAAPPAPDEAELRRWYDNHPWLYAIPEFRRIKAVVLTTQTLEKTLTATDDELRAYYDNNRALYVVPARRTVQVVVLHDEAQAKDLATKWQGGTDWTTIQQAAQAAGGSAVELDDTTEAGIPDQTLAKAAFTAEPDSIPGPVKTALGWDVLKIVKATPGSEQSFEQAKPEVRAHVLADKAAAQIYEAANKADDILGTGVGLDKLSSDIGAVGVQGTLGADGNTADGKPAPIPGPPELRKALVEAAFKTQAGQPPAQLTEVPAEKGASAYFALTVESISPPSEKPFDEVKAEVGSDWTEAARQRETEKSAAALLTAVKGGQSLADAATVAGVTARQSPLVSREAQEQGMPAALQHVLFGLRPKEPAMVQTPEGFVVAVPDKIEQPDPKDDPAAYNNITTALDRSIGTDLVTTFNQALRVRANPRVNQSVFDSFVTAQ